MSLSLARLLASPVTALLAGILFIGSGLLLPISRHSPSIAGRAISDVRDIILGRARATWCVFPYAQKWYTVHGGQFIEADDQLVREAPPGVPLILASVNTYPSGDRGLWAPTTPLSLVRVTIDPSGLSAAQYVQLRAQFVDELTAAGDPLIHRDLSVLRTANIHRTSILWKSWLHNAASLSLFTLFAASTAICARRAWRTFTTPAGHCRNCRYDLRATPTGSPCPECGAPRTLQPMSTYS